MLPLNVFLLLVVLAGAAYVRYGDLDARGVGHVEMYTPNIPLPAEISDPPPRLTLVSTLTGSLWEPHPPAWYLLNWPWTRVFGVSPTALRLPSVLIGVFAVFLLWRFAARERSSTTALVAAALLSVSGLHVMWSQLSRPVILVATIGIASSILLLRLVSSPSKGRLAAYLFLSFLGLATDHYYWFLLGGQIVWVFLVSRTRPAFQSLLDWQFATLAVASPLVTLAVAQGRESYLGARLLRTAASYTGFGFLFSSHESTFTVAPWMPATAIVLGLALALAGLVRSPRSRMADDVAVVAPGRMGIWIAGIAGTLAVIATAVVLASVGMEDRSRLLPTAITPAVFIAASMMTRRMNWRWLPQTVPPLSSVLCTVPVVTVLVISLKMPFVDAKYFLLFTPFLLIQIADGMVWLFESRAWAPRLALVAIVAVLAVLHVASLRYHSGIDATPIDFRALAAELRPALAETDRVLVYKHYAMTPVFYHLLLPASRYVGHEHAAVRTDGASRFWLISLRDTGIDDPPGYSEATKGCELTGTVTARRIRAERYENCLSR